MSELSDSASNISLYPLGQCTTRSSVSTARALYEDDDDDDDKKETTLFSTQKTTINVSYEKTSRVSNATTRPVFYSYFCHSNALYRDGGNATSNYIQ